MYISICERLRKINLLRIRKLGIRKVTPEWHSAKQPNVE